MSKGIENTREMQARIYNSFCSMVYKLNDFLSKCLFILTGIQLDFNNVDWSENVETYGDLEDPPAGARWYVKLFWDPEEEYLRSLQCAEDSYEGVRESGVLDFHEELEEIKSKRAKEKSKHDEVNTAEQLLH